MAGGSRGFSLIEMLVSVSVVIMLSAGLAGLLMQNSRINRAQQMQVQVQANARNTLSLLVQTLRSAGWDPLSAGIADVGLDPDPTDNVDLIEVFADLDADGLTTTDGERVLIRHSGRTVEWRRTAGGSFSELAVDISNDSDGDGVREPMFVALPNPNPTRIRVQITAESPAPDPTTGQPLRYTVSGDVTLRKAL